MRSDDKLMAYNPGLQVTDAGWLTLHRNENQFISRDFHSRILAIALNDLHFNLYPDPNNIEIRDELSALHGVPAAQIYIGNGSDGVISDLLTLFRKQYDEIVLPEVGYKVYDVLAGRSAFRVSRSHFHRGTEFDPSNKLILVDSPNAITGECISLDELAALASRPLTHLILDNCYGDYASPSIPIFPNKQLTIVRSFSKYFGLAGARIGYCVANESTVASLEAQREVYGVNAFAQRLALTALSLADEFRSLAEQMNRTKARLLQELNGLGFTTTKSEGNFVFVSHPFVPMKTILSGLANRRIAARHFDYPQTKDWMRIAIPADDMAETLIGALSDVIAQHRQDAFSAKPSPEDGRGNEVQRRNPPDAGVR